MLSRRQFNRLTAASLSSAALSGGEGVTVGAESFSFRDLTLEGCIDAMTSLGLRHCELFRGHLQPPRERSETWARYDQRMRGWRREASPEVYRAVRRKFDNAGIAIVGYDRTPMPEESDEEVELGFRMAHVLGVKYLFASAKVSLAPRIDALAGKHRVLVAYHNHSNLDPDAPTRPEDLETALAAGPNIRLAFDIGHFVAAGYDPLPFLEKHHGRMVAVHIKDRKRNQGPNVPFGEGDTPIREVLRMIRDRNYRLPALIEYEYKGGDTLAEVRRCRDYVRQALAQA
jgi:sugar phosphate isomerase/epimerase